MSRLRIACVGDFSPEFLCRVHDLARALPVAFAAAEDALRLPTESRPDLWLTDVLLPGVSGFEFARRMSARPSAPPVMVVTTLRAIWPLARSVRAGARGYLPLPVSTERLALGIERLLAGGAFRVAPEGAASDALLHGSPVLDLSPRRFEALHLLLQQEDAAGIARAMSISPRSAAGYRRALERELGIAEPGDWGRLRTLIGAGFYDRTGTQG